MIIERRKLPDRVVQFIKDRKLKMGSALDAACGSCATGPKGGGGGKYLRVLHEHFPKMRLFGCDLDSDEPVVFYGVEYKKCDFREKLPYEEKSIDMVLVTEMLDLFDEPTTKQILKHAERVAKKCVLVVAFAGETPEQHFPDKKFTRVDLPDYKDVWPGSTAPAEKYPVITLIEL